MSLPSTALCTTNSKCRCYKCSLMNAIQTNKIVDPFPNDLVHEIINYVGRYAIYGKLQNKHKVIFNLSNKIDDFKQIYFTANHAFIYSQNSHLFHSFMNPDNLQFNEPKELEFDSSIIASITNTFLNFLGVNTNNTVNNDKLIVSNEFNRNQEIESRFIVIKAISLEIFEIKYIQKTDKFHASRMNQIEDILKSFEIASDDNIKNVFYISYGEKYWFLFESGTLIEIPEILCKNAYPAAIGNAKAMELTVKAHDIAMGHNHALLIDKNNCLWIYGDNMYQQLGLWSNRPIFMPFKHPNIELFGNETIKSIECGAQCSSVIMDNGLCHLFGILRSENINTYNETIKFSMGINNENWTLFQKYKGFEQVRIVDVSFGFHHLILLDDKGNLYGIGTNHYQQISIQNHINVLKEPYLISKHEFDAFNAKKRIVKVLAAKHASFFVTRIQY